MSVLSRGQKTMFYALIVSSILMLVSIFLTNPRFLAIGLLQFTLTAFLGVWMNIKGRATIGNMIEYNWSRSDEYFKEKKFVRSAVYGFATPMIVLGVSIIFAWMLVVLFTGQIN